MYSLTNIPAHMSAYLGHVFLAQHTRVSAVLPILENCGKDNKRADAGLETSALFFYSDVIVICCTFAYSETSGSHF